MILPNPNKIITNLDLAMEYWGKYKEDDTINYKYNIEPYIKNKQIIFADLKSNIYGIFKDNETPLTIKYLATMIHYLCNEVSTDRYYIVPFEQLISFLDISQYLYVDFNKFALSIKYLTENKSIVHMLKEPVFVDERLIDIKNIDRIREKLLHFNLPLVYYAIHNFEMYLNSEDKNEWYLPIVILFRYYVYEFIKKYNLIDISKYTNDDIANIDQFIETYFGNLFIYNTQLKINYLYKIVDYLKNKLI